MQPINISLLLFYVVLLYRYNILNSLNTTKRKNKNNAYSAILKAAKKSDSPVLDCVMNVQHMSERDRAWYELYKQYGNRNHTWQDFRDMFDNNLETACKTVANWRTWTEINKLRDMAEQQKARVKHLPIKYKLQAIFGADFYDFQKKHPDLTAEFAKFLTLYYSAAPNYCTYNHDIAKLKQEFKQSGQNIFTKARYVKKMNKFITFKNADFVIAERLDNYYKILSKNPKFKKLKDAKKMYTNAMLYIAHTILDKSAVIHGAPKSDITLVKNGSNDGTYLHKTNDIELVNNFLHSHNFWRYLDTIIHEDTHRIDHKNPDYGMLGSQIMDPNFRQYSHLPDLYDINPTEQIAFYTADIITRAIKIRLQRKK